MPRRPGRPTEVAKTGTGVARVDEERAEHAATKALMRLAESCPTATVPRDMVDAALRERAGTATVPQPREPAGPRPYALKVTASPGGYRWTCECGAVGDLLDRSVHAAEASALRHVDAAHRHG